ncbi:MAG: magnesium transporter, partial [Cyanobium sp. MED195]|nr:magnesium transporter [Cyanobium sp. MED195]
MQNGITSKLSNSVKDRRFRRSSGALKPHRLSERPGDLPGPLFVHGGIAPTRIEALVFHPDGLQRRANLNLERLEDLKQGGAPLWLRVQGLGDPQLIEQVLALLAVPAELHPALVETPQRTRVDVLGESLQVVTHRFEMGASCQLISEQV